MPHDTLISKAFSLLMAHSSEQEFSSEQELVSSDLFNRSEHPAHDSPSHSLHSAPTAKHSSSPAKGLQNDSNIASKNTSSAAAAEYTIDNTRHTTSRATQAAEPAAEPKATAESPLSSEQGKPSTPDLIAAIDVGTNSFHLSIASVNSNGIFRAHSRDKESVRLGESVSDMKYISLDAMERGVAAMRRFVTMAKDAGASVIRAVGTSAMREALNRDEFTQRVRQETGIDIEVIAGTEEARLIYLGVLQALPVLDRQTLVIDIGGGSTETIIGFKGEMYFAHSAKLGAIRLTKRFFTAEKLSAKDIKECREFIKGEWASVFKSLLTCGFETAVGSSGTIQTIASIALARKFRDGRDPVEESLNGVTLSQHDIIHAIETILSEKTAKRRAELDGMDARRADIIVGGALILEQAVLNLDIKELTISEAALREGILLDTFQKRYDIERYHHLSKLRYNSVINLCDLCKINLKHAHHVKTLAVQLFDALQGLHGFGDIERELLEAASLMHDIGYHIAADQHHKHSYYIIRNADLLGFTNDEKEIIANIARYHRKSHPKAKHENFQKVPPEKRRMVALLSGILRIAEGLDRRGQQLARSLRVAIHGSSVDIIVSYTPADGYPDIELWSAERRIELLETVLSKRVFMQAEATTPVH
jgi:exopolyphosphatase/guanosine-5'-triphosphate,3'-diphosphate pyrophosphatase